MNWNFIPDENLNVNRVPNRNSLMKFEDGPLKDKDLKEILYYDYLTLCVLKLVEKN
jgi:hypothetical protein